MNPWLVVLAELVRAGVCVQAPAQVLDGHTVQVVTCATGGMMPQAAPIQPGGGLARMRPDLRSRG